MAALIRPTTLGELREFADIFSRSSLCPRAYKGKPEDIIIAVQHGSEIGLSPVQSVQNIDVIGGRPAVWGDALLALCYAHPACRGIREWADGEGEARVWSCEMTREGQPPTLRTFGVADAKRAKLWDERARVKRKSRDGNGTYETDNDAPWHLYPDRMLQMRARGFCARDTFPDSLKGLLIQEEAADIDGYEARRRAQVEAAVTSKVAPTPDGPALAEMKAIAWVDRLENEITLATTGAEVAEAIDRNEAALVRLEAKFPGQKARVDDIVADTMARFGQKTRPRDEVMASEFPGGENANT